MIEKAFVRVTDITDYLFCKRKVYLKRVLNYKEEKNEKSLIGSIIHNIFDYINENEEKIVYKIKENLGIDYILNLYKNFLNEATENTINKYINDIERFNLKIEDIKLEILKQISRDIEDRAKNLYNFILENDIYGIELWNYLQPKIKTEFEVNSIKYQITGRIDKIEEYKDKIIVYEIKSGYFKREHITQIYTYYLLLKGEFPKKRIEKGYIVYTNRGYKMEIDFNNRKEIYKILDIKDKILDIIENKEDPGKFYSEKCLKCPFYNICWKNGDKNRY